jgi:hypothetical protein
MTTHKLKTAYAAFVLGSLLAIALASLMAAGAALTYYDLVIDAE